MVPPMATEPLAEPVESLKKLPSHDTNGRPDRFTKTAGQVGLNNRLMAIRTPHATLS